MKNKLYSIHSIIFPNKKINYFTFFIILLGIISGSIFLVILKDSDKDIVISKISEFMFNVDSNKVNNLIAFKNAFIEYSIYVVLVWILGLSIIGIVINIFITYLRGFITGFSISSFILAYKYKGILASFIFAFPTCIINLITTFIISVYSFTFTVMLFKSIFNKTNNLMIKGYLKKYFLILGICMILVLLSSISEAFLLSSIMKLVVKLFI